MKSLTPFSFRWICASRRRAFLRSKNFALWYLHTREGRERGTGDEKRLDLPKGQHEWIRGNSLLGWQRFSLLPSEWKPRDFAVRAGHPRGKNAAKGVIAARSMGYFCQRSAPTTLTHGRILCTLCPITQARIITRPGRARTPFALEPRGDTRPPRGGTCAHTFLERRSISLPTKEHTPRFHTPYK